MTPSIPPPFIDRPEFVNSARQAECSSSRRGLRPAADETAFIDTLAAIWDIDLPARTATTLVRLLALRDAPSRRFHSWIGSALPGPAFAQLSTWGHSAVRARLSLIESRERCEFDVAQELAAPLWPDMLAAWTGLADQQRRRIHHLGRTLSMLLEPDRLSRRRFAALVPAIDESYRIFAHAYRYPRYLRHMPNLFATLATNWTAALGPLQDAAVLAAVHLLLASNDTAASILAMLLDRLIAKPSDLARLRANPESAAAAVVAARTRYERRLHARRSTSRVCSGRAIPPLVNRLADLQATAILSELVTTYPAFVHGSGRSAWRTRGDGVRLVEHFSLRVTA